MYDNISAMQAFADGTAITAHNIANISTDAYTSIQYTYASAPTNTVAVQVTSTDLFPVQSTVPVQEDTVSLSFLHTNNVEIASEFTQQISTQYAFAANAVTIVAHDELLRDTVQMGEYGGTLVSEYA